MREQLVAQQHELAIPVQLLTPDILHHRKNELDGMIARRAFQLFEGRGGGHGHDIDDWITAELELLRPYRHDLEESAEAVVFHAELPCTFTPDQLNVSVETRRLTISGEQELEVTCIGDVPTHDCIIVVVNCQNFLTVDSDVGARFFSLEKPEPIDLLILTHKVHTLDPERRTLSEMSGDLHNREILLIDPYLSFKEIGFPAFRNGVNN